MSAQSEDTYRRQPSADATAGSLSEHWGALVATAMLGTARRKPPPPPPGVLEIFCAPAPLAGGAPAGSDSAGDDRHDEARDLLGQVAALTAIRRAGVRPAAPPRPLAPCPLDDRPHCPPAAIRRLPELLQSWPILVDEWLAVVETSGFRLAPEDAVTLLFRYRSDPARRARVAAAAGPLAGWLQGLFPELLASRRGAAPTPAGASKSGQGGGSSTSRAPRAVLSEADQGVALPPDLAPLVELSAEALAEALVEGVDQRRWVHRHRPLLARLICLVDPGVLPVVADRLASGVVDPSNVVLATDLAHLSRTRADMLAELVITASLGFEQAEEEPTA
jgi:hypothetical protein